MSYYRAWVQQVAGQQRKNTFLNALKEHFAPNNVDIH